MDGGFSFIVSSGPKLQTDAQTRTLIRKQAMRDAALARKKKTTSSKQCTDAPIRPSPSGASSDTPTSARSDVATSSIDVASSARSGSDTSLAASDTRERELDELVNGRLSRKDRSTSSASPFTLIQTPSLVSAYETTRSRFSIDIMELSILTNFNISKSCIPALAANPGRLTSLFHERQFSYLNHVPSRYGASECLTAATDCVLAKARSVITPGYGHEETELRLYAKALRSVQQAICSESGCVYSDVLCATELLSLRELLDSNQANAWSQHVNGAARVVKHRGIRRFKSAFEKALFVGHVGPIVSETLLSDEHCYLAEPEWSDLYLSLVVESEFLTDNHPLTQKLIHSMFVMPGLWHDVGELVSGPQLFDEDAIADLQQRCRTFQSSLLDWTEDYKAHCVRLSLASPPITEINLRRELFGTSLECLLIVKRLLATLCEPARLSLENEAQALALLLLGLQQHPGAYSWMFHGREEGLAQTVRTTRDDWEEEPAATEMERKLAARNRYNTWNHIIRSTEGA